tara:strand:+ start:1950 stop:2459 length:510 start_codon:yes stop_codon:yes gene_type:complete
MKRTIISTAICIAASGLAMADDALVLDTAPKFESQIRYETVPQTFVQCGGNPRSPRGVVERGVNGVFGSTEGLIGAAIGTAIGNEIGGGSGNEAAKVIGAVLGNKIGNNRAIARAEVCTEVTKNVQRQYTEQVIVGYNVKVGVNGSEHWIYRNFQPQVGSYIPVQVSVQ